MTRYSRLQIALHWAVAALILATWWLGDDMDDALEDRMEAAATGLAGSPLHVWLGCTIFALVLLRIAVRLAHGAPAPEDHGRPLLRLAIHGGHLALYALLLLAPLAGMSAWFLGLEEAADAHEFLTGALMLLALVHAAIAIGHHLVLRDDTLRRMLPLLR